MKQKLRYYATNESSNFIIEHQQRRPTQDVKLPKGMYTNNYITRMILGHFSLTTFSLQSWHGAYKHTWTIQYPHIWRKFFTFQNSSRCIWSYSKGNADKSVDLEVCELMWSGLNKHGEHFEQKAIDLWTWWCKHEIRAYLFTVNILKQRFLTFLSLVLKYVQVKHHC